MTAPYQSKLLSSTIKTQRNLFDFPQSILPDRGNLTTAVILDRTGIYPIPSSCTAICTEVEWLRSFFVEEGIYWIRGERLCKWTEAWLSGQDRSDAIIEEKICPKQRLANLFAPLPLPASWTDQQILAVVVQLDVFPVEKAFARLLSNYLDVDPKFWSEEPSIEHLATWLTIQVPDELKPIIQVWQYSIGTTHPDLAQYYQADNKISLLRQWLGIEAGKIQTLGKYPLDVPNFIQNDFNLFWQQQILDTEGQVIQEIVPYQQVGMNLVAAQAYDILKTHPEWIAREQQNKLSHYLDPEKRNDLHKRLAPVTPTMLPIDASSTDAMDWATNQYLPFRLWETTVAEVEVLDRVSDKIAASFVNWIFTHYPSLKSDPVSSSCLNYSVTSLVQDICQNSPVLWVVVDGLGWLDHQELIQYLTQDRDVSVERSIEPRFSILPTKTEYAKWSLYTQLLPNDSHWQADAGKGFPWVVKNQKFSGQRYTDRKFNQLIDALQTNQHQLYCWDTILLDDCYHQGYDWRNLYDVQRPIKLKEIAQQIIYLIKKYPEPEKLQIVIASDHGQLMGRSQQLYNAPQNIEIKGRVALGETDDERFVVLGKHRFGLPDDISVLKSSATFGTFSYNTDSPQIGSHGGLFPEEVVVGVSILRQTTQRYPVSVICKVQGEANQSGELEIIINNPNQVSLENLCLYINELSDFKNGYQMQLEVEAKSKVTKTIIVSNCPSIPIDRNEDFIPISGILEFQFAGVEPSNTSIDKSSRIEIRQVFQSGFNIDEFL